MSEPLTKLTDELGCNKCGSNTFRVVFEHICLNGRLSQRIALDVHYYCSSCEKLQLSMAGGQVIQRNTKGADNNDRT